MNWGVWCWFSLIYATPERNTQGPTVQVKTALPRIKLIAKGKSAALFTVLIRASRRAE